MRRALVLALGTALCTAGLALAVPALSAPAAKGKWTAPRNAMGQPDLSGHWSNATLTPLTRNRRISDKATLTPAEAKEFETVWAKALAEADEPTDPNATTQEVQKDAQNSKLLEIRPDFAAAGGDVGGYNTFWIDPGTKLVEIDGQYRTSILTTPNGLPPQRKKDAQVVQRQYRDVYDSYEYRSIGERCIMGFGRNAGPPMLPNGYYNNNYQILQSPDAVVIDVELIHDARIVRLNSKHRTDGVRPWMGDSIGWYDGDTLVIETTNIPEDQDFMGSWKNLKVTEWLTRVAPDKILYRFQLEDPTVWDQPWGGEYVFHPLKGMVYEYACHEGNYALPGILAGARHAERDAKAATEAAKPAADTGAKPKPGSD